MNCLVCGHANPGTVAFCTKCGRPLDFSADEIREALIARQKEQRKKGAEFYGRQVVIAAAVVFLLAVTAFILGGGAPKEVYITPPVTGQAKYLAVERRVEELLGYREPADLAPVLDFPVERPR